MKKTKKTKTKIDIIEHAFLNSRSITGGDERRMRAVLEEHRPAALKEKP